MISFVRLTSDWYGGRRAHFLPGRITLLACEGVACDRLESLTQRPTERSRVTSCQGTPGARSGATGAVTLIQRFGSALNLNVHFHMLYLDGAYLADTSPPVFRRIEPPSERELQAPIQRIVERIGRTLERSGLPL
jgi:Putative transposase